jgi:hypothetical protein
MAALCPGVRARPVDGIAHASHAPELVAIGWVLTPGEDGIPDCCCPHYHQANWIGDHGDDCCEGEAPGEQKAPITDGHRDGGSPPPVPDHPPGQF